MASTHLLKSVSFAGSAILSLTDCTESPNATINRLHTDAARTINLIFADMKSATISVTSADLRYMSTITIGKVGALIVAKQLRQQGGDDPASPALVTATYANCVCTGVSVNDPIVGNSSVTFTFEASDPAGASVVSFS